MLKSVLLAATVTLSFAPLAQAQDAMLMCDEATFQKLDMAVDKLSDPAMQDMKNAAAKEVAIAKSDMDQKDTNGCLEHLQKASDIIAMKM